jgi:nickel/cobalt exporter
MFLLIFVFFLGIVHGLGPDHLAAITVFGSRGGRQAHRLAWFSIRFALGHAFVIVLAGISAKLGKSLMSAWWEAKFDIAGGAFLIATGLLLMIGLFTGKFHAYMHEQHEHRSGDSRFFHFHGPQNGRHPHGRFALLLGAFFAMGGFRALLAVAPIALASGLGQSILRIALFTLGIVVSMLAYGLLSGSLLQRLEQAQGAMGRIWVHASGYAVGIFSVVAGLLTLHEHLG